MNEVLRKKFKDVLSEMYPDNPAGIHGLVVSILMQELNIHNLTAFADRVNASSEAKIKEGAK